MKIYGEFLTMPIQASDVVMVAREYGDVFYHPLQIHIGSSPSHLGIRVFREGITREGHTRIYTNGIEFFEHFHRKNTRKAKQ